MTLLRQSQISFADPKLHEAYLFSKILAKSLVAVKQNLELYSFSQFRQDTIY
jgi:hypothetical protein